MLECFAYFLLTVLPLTFTFKQFRPRVVLTQTAHGTRSISTMHVYLKKHIVRDQSCWICEIRSIAMKACIVPSWGMTIYQWNFQRSKQSRLSCHPRWRQRCLWSTYCKQQEDLLECSLLFIYHKILEINYHTAQGIIISDQKRCCWSVMQKSPKSATWVVSYDKKLFSKLFCTFKLKRKALPFHCSWYCGYCIRSLATLSVDAAIFKFWIQNRNQKSMLHSATSSSIWPATAYRKEHSV